MTDIYRITVELIRNEEVTESRRYIGQTEPNENGGTEDVYSTSFTKVKEVTREIYSQELSDIDLQEIIWAVNTRERVPTQRSMPIKEGGI